MIDPAEELPGDGVRLRRWHAEDVNELLRITRESIEHLAPWMPWATLDYDRDSAAAFLAGCVRDWQAGTAFQYAILTPAGDPVGSVGLMSGIGEGGLEIGYWLHPDHTGSGLATEAVRTLTAEAFRIGADRVEISHDLANLRSKAIPQRLGFTQVGTCPPRDRVTPADCGITLVWRLSAAR